MLLGKGTALLRAYVELAASAATSTAAGTIGYVTKSSPLAPSYAQYRHRSSSALVPKPCAQYQDCSRDLLCAALCDLHTTEGFLSPTQWYLTNTWILQPHLAGDGTSLLQEAMVADGAASIMSRPLCSGNLVGRVREA